MVWLGFITEVEEKSLFGFFQLENISDLNLVSERLYADSNILGFIFLLKFFELQKH